MINVKKSQINSIFNIIDSIKINKINNASIRKSVLKLVIAIPKIQKEAREDIEKFKKKFFSEFKQEDLQNFDAELNQLFDKARKTNQSVDTLELSTKYPDIFKAYLAFNDTIYSLENEMVELEIDPINIVAFIEEMVNQDVNISSKEIEILQPVLVEDLKSISSK